jgi:hypothetical protein
MRHLLPLALAAMVITSAAAQPQRFTLGVVRLDGRIVPFAAYDGGRWEKAWPEANEATDITTIDTVPSVWLRRGDRVPSVWRVWPATGGPPIQARVSGIENVEAHCSVQVALRTNLPGAKAEHPRKFGIAVDSSSVPIGAVEEVRRSDPMRAAAERTVLAGFTRLETAQATGSGEQLPRETPAPAVQIVALHRETTSPSPVYFIAVRTYRTARNPRDPQCSARTMMTGWLMPTTAGTFTLIDPTVFLTDCDRKEVITGLPLAALRVSRQRFWVLQQHGYEGEAYVIAEIRQSGIRYPIEASGGGC